MGGCCNASWTSSCQSIKRSPTLQGSLHLECLHLPPKVGNTTAEQYQEQGGLLAAWEIGKLTQGSDQQARQMRNRLRAKATRESAALQEGNALCTRKGKSSRNGVHQTMVFFLSQAPSGVIAGGHQKESLAQRNNKLYTPRGGKV